MASRPSKRQKRLIVLSSDDETQTVTQDQASLKAEQIRKKGLKDELANDNVTYSQALPRRSRPNTRSATLRPRSSASADNSPPLSPKKPKPGRLREAKHENTRSLRTYFNPKECTTQSNINSQHLSSVIEADGEVEDIIDDDSSDAEAWKCLSSQDTTRFVLDRRKQHLLPTRRCESITTSAELPSASQRFIFTETPLNDEARKCVDNKLDQTDLRPWAEKYAPTVLEELMVHKKKVGDVQKWMENFWQNRGSKVWLCKTAQHFQLSCALTIPKETLDLKRAFRGWQNGYDVMSS